MTLTPGLLALAPAVICGLGAVLVLLVDAVMTRSQAWQRALGAVVLLGALGVTVRTVAAGEVARCLDPLAAECTHRLDGPSAGLHVLAALGALVALVLVGRAHRDAPGGLSVTVALVLTSTAGASLVAVVTDIVTLVVALEVATVPLVALVALRGTARAGHAALSLLVTSLTSFALVVVGAALWVTASGSVRLVAPTTEAAVADPVRRALLVLAALVVVAGLAFKLSLVPFHAWTPQAYRDADLGVVTLLVTVSKATALGGLLALLRPLAMTAPLTGLRMGLAALGLTSMLVGGVIALRQRTALGLVAWSTVAQAGWVVLPLIALGQRARQVSVSYLVVYAVATLVALVAIASAHAAGERPGGGELTAYRGLIRRDPLTGGALALALLVLAGLPPGVIGLVAKVLVLRPLTEEGRWPLALVAVIGVVLGIAVYLRWLVELLRRPREGEGVVPERRLAHTVLLVVGALVLGALSVAPSLLLAPLS